MEQNIEDYSSASVYDLIDDKRFIQWIYLSTETLDQYWITATKRHPHLALIIPEAKRLLLSIKFKETVFAKEREDLLWLKIKTEASAAKPKTQTVSLFIRGLAAAIVIGFLISLSLIYFTGQRTISAAYGEIRNVTLPDGSVVTLNANSQLKFNRFWHAKQVREVWLSGEAFFNVKHLHKEGKISPGDRFIVHASQINVEVLGTSFNVNDRHNLVNVALVAGKVSMSTTKTGRHPVILVPGDVFEYLSSQDTIIHKKIKSVKKTAWKDKTLVFDETPSSEVFAQLEDIYGYKVIVQRAEVRNKKVSGSFNMANEANLIKAISLALNVTIKKDEVKHQLIIQ